MKVLHKTGSLVFIWVLFCGPGYAADKAVSTDHNYSGAKGDSGTRSSFHISVEEMKEILRNINTRGRSLKPKSWANGAKVAVTFSSDIDNQFEVIALGGRHPLQLSFREYGTGAALKRMVKVFDDNKVPATWYVPAITVETMPEVIKTLNTGRHEFAAHGWVHERIGDLSEENQRLSLERSISLLEHATGKRPVGWRGPGASFGKNTFHMLHELGFLYDSNLGADDNPYELLVAGKPSGLIELPIHFNLSDIGLTIPDKWANGLYTPREVLQQAKDAFDVAYEEGNVFHFAVHPHIISRPSRIIVLKELIKYIKQHKGVWFATNRQIIEFVAK